MECNVERTVIVGKSFNFCRHGHCRDIVDILVELELHCGH